VIWLTVWMGGGVSTKHFKKNDRALLGRTRVRSFFRTFLLERADTLIRPYV